LSLPSIVRLGLRQLVAGMLSVLALGILNRVMKIEMGLDLGLVGLVIGAHYFAAPIAIPLGYRSDRRPIRGLHRTPYILAGTALTALATAAAPFVALWMEAQGGGAVASAIAILNFLALGAGMYTAGTAYLSLIADLVPEGERSKAISIVWSMMMVGILAGVFLGIGALDAYSPAGLIRLFLIVAVGVAALTIIAIWKQERPGGATPSAVSTRQAVALLGARQPRLFFTFLTSGILFLFLQQVVLEPFGGDIFGMSIRQTTLFNAYQMVGVLAGMAVAGAWLARRLGEKRTAGLGLLIASLSFLLLGMSSIYRASALVAPGITLMGLGMGLFNVGGLALMMGMSTAGRNGIFMGAWTLAQAVANGIASTGGGYIYDLGLGLLGSEPAAYASVFLLESVGLVATILLLALISQHQFQAEAAARLAPA
jgi:BCD family chlorophyll transporter-like MFS transporter